MRILRLRDQVVDSAALAVVDFNICAVRAALEKTLAGGQIKLAFDLLAAVAFEAILDQEGTDLLLKKLQPAGHALRVVAGQRGRGRDFGP